MANYIEDVPNKYMYDTKVVPPYVSEDRENFEYWINLRLYMAKLNPPGNKARHTAQDYDGRSVQTLRWDDASWLHFRSKFLQKVMDVWDKAFMLIPPAKYDGFQWPSGGTRRNLVCRLRIKIQDSPQDAHASVRVVRLANPTTATFRSDSETFDSSDLIDKRNYFRPRGASFLHNTPAHEVGHLLGLWHSGEADAKCDTMAPTSACYGTNLYDRMNIMGAGSMLDLSNAFPWLRRIAKHAPTTKEEDWKVKWASGEAMGRGIKGLDIDEAAKQRYDQLKAQGAQVGI